MTKLLLTLTLATFGIISCKSQTNQGSIDRFWKWFEINQKRIRGFESYPDQILTEVSDSAKKIQRGLAIEFEPPANGIVVVTISADGDKNLFPIVKTIVQKAPKIAGWSFVAFRQRFPKDKVISLVLKAQNHELNVNKMRFFPVISGDSLDILIFADNVTQENFNQVAYGGLLIVDNILGEYDCVTKVRSYDFQNMPTKPEELKELIPLVDLAEYVDNFHKSKHH
jgi:hypothetical protein